MAFLLERFDVVKQHYDGTGIFHYHDNVSTTVADPTSGKTGDALATIVANNYFNPVVDQLAIGSLILISTDLACRVCVVTGLYDTDGKTPKVVLTAAS